MSGGVFSATIALNTITYCPMLTDFFVLYLCVIDMNDVYLHEDAV